MISRLSSEQGLGEALPTRRDGAAWMVLAILLLFSIAAPLNQFKVPPIMPVLMKWFKVSVGQAGLLMSVYAITGLVLALPAGLIFQKAGYRLTSLLAGGSIVVGAAWGALSSDMTSLLASRVIEGVGTSFMAVLAPAVIALWFRPQKRGAAMGIWSTWVPIGSTAMLIVAPLLTQAGSWHTVWWCGAAYALLATLLALTFVRPARRVNGAGTSADGAARPPAMSAAQVLRRRDLWLLSAAFGCFNMVVLAAATYLPTYLTLFRGMSLPHAGLLASIPFMVSIVAGPASGVFSDLIGSRKRPYAAGLVLLAAAMPLIVLLGHPGALLVLLLVQGLALGLVPTNIFSAGVEAVGDERLSGMAMAIIMVGQNAGFLLGPAIFGRIVESSGSWPLAFGSLAVMGLVGAAAGWLARVK